MRPNLEGKGRKRHEHQWSMQTRIQLLKGKPGTSEPPGCLFWDEHLSLSDFSGREYYYSHFTDKETDVR
jgi:hypothetical protein